MTAPYFGWGDWDTFENQPFIRLNRWVEHAGKEASRKGGIMNLRHLETCVAIAKMLGSDSAKKPDPFESSVESEHEPRFI